MPVKIALGKKGVTADHYLAVKAGIEILEEGGNAFDAAIAVSSVLSIVQPQMGGPGGDGFLLGFVNDEVIAYASSGRSPSGFDPDKYLEVKAEVGPLTVTIPGLVYLWGMINEEYGTLPLSVLLRRAISIAYNGFRAGWFLAHSSKSYHDKLSPYKWSKYFSNIQVGSLVTNKDAARTLRMIATRGWDEFYYGRIAEELVAELQEQGVDLGLEDFMEHEGWRVDPLKLELDGKQLFELPPNSQGIVTLNLISALHELGLDKYDFNDPSRILAWSHPIEVSYMFRDNYLGDPDYLTINPYDYVHYSRLPQDHRSPNEAVGDGDTTFFIVSDGEATIGFIQSLFHPFGSGLVAGGFPVQNRGIGFAKSKGLPNSPAPKKLPLHTLSVLGVSTDKEKYVIGCVGGDYRPQLHLRVYENIFVYHMSIPGALDSPRFLYTIPYGHQQVVAEQPLKPPVSSNIPVNIIQPYSSPGHVHVGVITLENIVLGNDPRSEGTAMAL
ncbi:MAG: gamma-glutamyltransferase [Thermosphaera sp.]